MTSNGITSLTFKAGFIIMLRRLNSSEKSELQKQCLRDSIQRKLTS